MLRKLRGLFRLAVSVHHIGVYIFVRQAVPRADLQEQSIFLQFTDNDRGMFVRNLVPGRVAKRFAPIAFPPGRRLPDTRDLASLIRLRSVSGYRIFYC